MVLNFCPGVKVTTASSHAFLRNNPRLSLTAISRFLIRDRGDCDAPVIALGGKDISARMNLRRGTPINPLLFFPPRALMRATRRAGDLWDTKRR